MAAGFSVTISASDQISGTIDKINKKLQAFSAPYERMAASMRKFGDVSGLNRVAKAFGDVGKSAFDAFRNVTRIVEPLGAIAGAASVAGMYRLASAWAEWGSRLGYNAERIGTTANRLNTLQNAARLAGVSADSMTQGMTHLKDAMTDALAGRNDEAMQYFQRLGISLQQLRGPAESVLPKIVQKIGQLEKSNPTLAARVTSAIFGSEELLRLFRGGLPALQAYLDQAQKLGGVTEEQAKRADQLRQSQAALTIAVEQFGYTLASALQPVIGPVIDYMTNWIAANRDWLASAITDDVRAFVDQIKAINWKDIRQDFSDWYQAVKKLVDALGGPQAAIRDLMIVMAGGFALKVITPFLTLAGAIDTAILKFGKLVLAARAASVASAAATVGEGAAAGGVMAGAASLAGTVLVGAAVTATVAYLTAHGLSWLFGKGWNDTGPVGRTANAANHGHDPNTAIHDGSGARRGIDQSTPRGIRNNNPLNLTYLPGQGAVGSDGRFGQYATMSAGIAAAERQLLRYQGRGIDTLTGIVSKWAPSNENDTNGYIARVAKATGFRPDQRLDLSDPKTAEAVIAAMSHVETGRSIGSGDIHSGVYAALGLPGAGAPAAAMPSAPGAAGAAGASGKVVVHVQTDPGTKAQVRSTSGNVAAPTPGVARTVAGTPYAA